jgi:uncharacterized membrane protein YkvA (DUF1232 family)
VANQTPNRTPTQSKTGLLTEILRNGQLAWRLFADRRVSTALKLIIPGLLGAYLLWPADLLPDVIPILGQLDDLTLLALGIKVFVELCPKDIVREYRDNLAGKAAPRQPGSDPGETVDAEYRVVE